MAKSISPRILIDEETGKQYQFNRYALRELIASRTDKEKHITQGSILLALEEEKGISTSQINKWLYGGNGIGSIENVKTVSDFFNIDYHDLLIDMNPKIEDKIMINEEEINIIKKVFSECVATIYTVPSNINPINISPLDRIECRKAYLCKTGDTFRKLHQYVDQNCLSLRKYNRYNLHRILFELQEYIISLTEFNYYSFCERWENIGDNLAIQEAVHFAFESNRNRYLLDADDIDSRIYLVDEIALVENMGLASCNIPSDEEWDSLSDIGDCSHFGYTANHEECNITPQMIWTDLVVTMLTEVFKSDFSLDLSN